MTGTVLERSLNSVIARLQKLRILRRQAACWIVLLLPAILVTLLLPRRTGAMTPELLVVLVTTLIGIFVARMLVRNPSRTEAARLIKKIDVSCSGKDTGPQFVRRYDLQLLRRRLENVGLTFFIRRVDQIANHHR